MDISITAKSVTSNPNSRQMIDVDIDGVDESDLVNLLDAKDIVKHKGAAALLDEIGEDECRKHFNIKGSE